MYKFDVKLLGSNNSIGVTIWMSMEKKHLNTKAASPIPRLPSLSCRLLVSLKHLLRIHPESLGVDWSNGSPPIPKQVPSENFVLALWNKAALSTCCRKASAAFSSVVMMQSNLTKKQSIHYPMRSIYPGRPKRQASDAWISRCRCVFLQNTCSQRWESEESGTFRDTPPIKNAKATAQLPLTPPAAGASRPSSRW